MRQSWDDNAEIGWEKAGGRRMKSEGRRIQTLVAHDEHDGRHYGAVHVPVYDSSLFTFASVAEMDEAVADMTNRYVYSRGNNPTVRELERRLAALEGGEKARCFGSGMGAIAAAVLSSVQAGDHIVCVDQAYGPARNLMGTYVRRFGIETDFVDGTDVSAIEAAIRPNTKLLYLESPSSLVFRLQDLRACAALARRHGLTTVVDNTWATPCFQNPLAYGIDLVVHSLTKYIGGHSDALGGAVIGRAERVEAIDGSEMLLLGSVMHPHTAAAIIRGLRTLPIRMQRHQASGLAIASYLESLPGVERVHYPGLASHPDFELSRRQMSGYGGLLSFEAGVDRDRLARFADGLRYFRIGFSWGGYESLVSVQEAAGVPLVRLYAGLEEPVDLIGDLASAFRQAGFAET